MSYALLDDGYPSHPKIVPLSDAAFRIHTSALCHVKRYRTGGFIARGTETALHPTCRGKKLRDALVELESGIGSPTGSPLWEIGENGWHIHDHERWFGESPEEAGAAREVLDQKRWAALSQNRAEAGRLGGLKSAEARRSKFGTAQPKQPPEANPKHPEANASEANPEAAPKQPEAGSQARASDPDPDPDRSDQDPSDPLVTGGNEPDPWGLAGDSGAAAPDAPEGKHIREVFEHWQTARTHPLAKLTRERAAKIRARLREGYSVEDLKAAIDGVEQSPHHRGENDEGRIWDDLELICRNGSKVEMFRELARGAGRVTPISRAPNRAPNRAQEAIDEQLAHVAELERQEALG